MDSLRNVLRLESDKIGEQKSQSWLDWRKDKITGTDMSKIYSKSDNPKDMHELLEKKLGFVRTPFEGNVATDHGNFYEDVAIKAYEIITGNTVELFNGMRHKDCKHIGMSPDGVVFKEDEIILIEVKCPYSRKIDEKIATGYKFQMQCGMAVLNSWGAKNVKTHFVQFKPQDHGAWSKNEILSINSVALDKKIESEMVDRADKFFEWVEENRGIDFDGFLEE